MKKDEVIKSFKKAIKESGAKVCKYTEGTRQFVKDSKNLINATVFYVKLSHTKIWDEDVLSEWSKDNKISINDEWGNDRVTIKSIYIFDDDRDDESIEKQIDAHMDREDVLDKFIEEQIDAQMDVIDKIAMTYSIVADNSQEGLTFTHPFATVLLDIFKEINISGKFDEWIEEDEEEYGDFDYDTKYCLDEEMPNIYRTAYYLFYSTLYNKINGDRFDLEYDKYVTELTVIDSE